MFIWPSLFQNGCPSQESGYFGLWAQGPIGVSKARPVSVPESNGRGGMEPKGSGFATANPPC